MEGCRARIPSGDDFCQLRVTCPCHSTSKRPGRKDSGCGEALTGEELDSITSEHRERTNRGFVFTPLAVYVISHGILRSHLRCGALGTLPSPGVK